MLHTGHLMPEKKDMNTTIIIVKIMPQRLLPLLVKCFQKGIDCDELLKLSFGIHVTKK